MTTAPTPAPASSDPWERFGWLMGAIWLVFLAFPIVGLATSDQPVVWRVLGVGGILIFAAAYVRGFIAISTVDTWDQVVRTGVRYLMLLALIILALVPLLGSGVLSHLPYVVALAMFSLPLTWAFTVAGAAVLTCVVVPLTLDTLDETWYFILIVTLVAVSTGIVRVFEQHGNAHRTAQAELALAAERDRVARDVHDVLGHSLTVVTIKAELAQRVLESDPARASAELDEIQALSRTALAEIRATVSGLRVAGLAHEIEAAGAALRGAGIGADLPQDLSVVDPRHRVLLAWVLREAVTNVVRHSGATHCRVDLGAARLRVTDDGRGPRGHREGNGLLGVRERTAAAGGTLTFGPGPSGGTVLEVVL